MKLIIAGSRNLFIDDEFIFNGLIPLGLYEKGEYLFNEIVSGNSGSVDLAAESFANCWAGLPLKRFKANWLKYGRAAGPIRNKEMAEYGDALLLIWDGESKGSLSMKKEMKKLNKPIYEIILKKDLTRHERCGRIK